MNSKEWLAAKNPYPMFDFLGRTVSPRKLRLFGIACCRRLWNLMAIDECREAVILAERLVEGEAAPEEVARLRDQLKAQYLILCDRRGSGRKRSYVRLWCIGAAKNVLQDEEGYLRGEDIRAGDADLLWVWRSASSAVDQEDLDEKYKAQADLLRETLGNPLCPVKFDPLWRTPTVVRLARGIYAEQAFDQLPILADALQDAGCGDTEVLQHCRGAGPHVRGCWVVDLVLEKG